MVGVSEQRFPLTEVSSSFSLSFVVHGLLVLAIVYVPQWLHGKPFKVPVSYEVTLVSPGGPGSERKVATAAPKAVAQPRDLLTLPSLPRPVIPGAAVRLQPPPTRTDEMTLPAKGRLSQRRPAVPSVAPPAPPKIVAPQISPAPAISRPVAMPSSETQGFSASQGLAGPTETGVTVGSTDPALAYYFVLIQDKITGNWTPPKMSPGTTASVSLSLRILRSGQVRDLAVNSSSSDRLLDDSAVRAVRLSTPLPPLPPLFKAETLLLELRFTFVGEKS